MSRRAARASAVLACVLPWACTEPNPYLPRADGTGTSGTGDAGVTSSTTSAAGTLGAEESTGAGQGACTGPGSACVAVAPAGFEGPIAWLERPSESPLPCPAPFEDERVEAFSELSAPASSCACTCGGYSNGGCGGRLERHLSAACAGPLVGIDLSPGCNVLGGVGWVDSSGFEFEATVEGGCIPLPSSELPPAAFLTRHLACGAAEISAAGCEDGRVCLPVPVDPYRPQLCVWQEGDVACPEEGDYTARILLYRSIDDQRGCEACTCSLPAACEGAMVSLSTDTDCNPVVADVSPDTCDGIVDSGSIRSVLLEEGTPPQACQPALVVPTGEAAGAEPLTMCCTP